VATIMAMNRLMSEGGAVSKWENEDAEAVTV